MNNKIEISLCLIVKNEEAVLARCLNSAKDFVDEIIVVDTGSTDKTKEIAQLFTDKIFDFQWINDFSAARNFAFSMATKDYQMWLDADDIVPEKSIKLINELKKNLSSDIDIVTMNYLYAFDKNDNPILSFKRERILKKSKNYQWIDPVHECIPLNGNVFNTEIEIWHRKTKLEVPSTRNIDIYNNLESSGKVFTPRQMYYFARELRDHKDIRKSIIYYEKFLETGSGWSEDVINSCFELAKAYKKIDQKEKILPVLFKSFEYDIPRPEICCEIGYYFKDLKKYNEAFKWFDLATRLPESRNSGFLVSDYLVYIPNVEACVCLSLLGDFKKANEYNEKATVVKPNCPSVLHNREYLRSRI